MATMPVDVTPLGDARLLHELDATSECFLGEPRTTAARG